MTVTVIEGGRDERRQGSSPAAGVAGVEGLLARSRRSPDG